MRREYDKLVRDRIPEIIRRDGRKCGVERMGTAEYRVALLDKLVEEAAEARRAAPEQLPAELADLYEVIDATLSAFGIGREAVLREQEQRRADRGGFDEQLRLRWTE